MDYIYSMNTRLFINVLIADDAVEIRQRIAEAITELDSIAAVISKAKDGDEAYSLFESLRPDIAILDLQMPGLNGLDLIKAIRDKCSKIKILVVTVFDGPDFKNRCLEAGADAFLNKNAEFHLIPNTIQAIVN